jgi:hypothetical protein
LPFPETQEILDEAEKKQIALKNYVKFLDKKISAFQRKKVDAFVETYELKEQRKQELLKNPKQLKRLYALRLRNASVKFPEESRSAEMDFAEMQELEKKLEPTLAKIKEVEERIEKLKFAETRKALLEDITTAENMAFEIELLTIKAYVFEFVHAIQETEQQRVIKELKSHDTPNYKSLPRFDGYYFSETGRNQWKGEAEKAWKDVEKQIYADLEKFLKEGKKPFLDGLVTSMEETMKLWKKPFRIEIERKEDKKND